MKNASVAALPALKLFSWRQVESEDYKKYIANLRALGCPEQTIRDIILADINKLYFPRENPLRTNLVVRSGTTRTNEVSLEEYEKRKQLRAIQLEKRAVVKELLGIELPVDLLPSTHKRSYEMFEAAFRNLPAEKRDAIQMLTEQYWLNSDVLRDKYKDNKSPEYLAEYKALNEGQRAELAKILTPAEQADFEMRTSASAIRLTQQMQGVTLSDDEFKKMYQIMDTYEQQMGKVGNRLSAATVDADTKTAAQAQLQQQFRTVLGDERYRDYELAQDANARSLTQVAQRYNLPPDVIAQAIELRKSIQQQTPKVQAGQPMTPEFQQQLTQFNKDSEARMTQLLGADAYKAVRAWRPAGTDVFEP